MDSKKVEFIISLCNDKFKPMHLAEIQKQLEDWGVDFLNEIEKELERKLTERDLKKILLHGIGFAEDYKSLLEALL